MHPWPWGWRLGEAPDLHVLASCHSCSEARPGSQQRTAAAKGGGLRPDLAPFPISTAARLSLPWADSPNLDAVCAAQPAAG